jgi:hypothetical protein
VPKSLAVSKAACQLELVSAKNAFTKVSYQLKTGVSARRMVAQKWLWLNATVTDLLQNLEGRNQTHHSNLFIALPPFE